MSRRPDKQARGARSRWSSAACLALACAVSCGRSSAESRVSADLAAAQTTEPPPLRAAAPSSIVHPNPTRLLAARGSAYGVTLAEAEDGSYLLTGNAAYRWAEGEAPARWARDFGFGHTLTAGHIVYWSKRAVRMLPTGGGEATTIARVPNQPQRIVGSGDHVAWLEQTDGRFSIHTLDGSKPRLVHAAEGYVGTLAMEDERIYFAERAPDRSWRLGLVSRSGGAAHYTTAKRGRLPSMLAVAESLYYYDGPSSTVLKVSPDLGSEAVLARDVICSPIAVAENVYCAQPAGLVEIGLDGGVRRALPLEQRGAVTAIAATASHLTWVTDVGDDQLAVDRISFTGAEALSP